MHSTDGCCWFLNRSLVLGICVTISYSQYFVTIGYLCFSSYQSVIFIVAENICKYFPSEVTLKLCISHFLCLISKQQWNTIHTKLLQHLSVLWSVQLLNDLFRWENISMYGWRRVMQRKTFCLSEMQFIHVFVLAPKTVLHSCFYTWSQLRYVELSVLDE